MESSRRERERERRMMMRGPGSSGSVLREKGPGRVFNIGTNPEDFDLEGDYMEVSLRTKRKKKQRNGFVRRGRRRPRGSDRRRQSPLRGDVKRAWASEGLGLFPARARPEGLARVFSLPLFSLSLGLGARPPFSGAVADWNPPLAPRVRLRSSMVERRDVWRTQTSSTVCETLSVPF